jgi:formate hydrogenlyase subunit 3/multisubunit Na+/H+ antiporter MnhD subunit
MGLSLGVALTVVTAWLLIGLSAIIVFRRAEFITQRLFPLSGLCGLVLLGVGLYAVFSAPETALLPIGLPGLPFHLRLDSLAAFFLIIIGGAGSGVSAFAARYFQREERISAALLCLQYHIFLASMVLVVLADDAYMFMVMWEVMAVSSFFLVTADHRLPEIRRAGYLYLLIAHVGAIAILLCFGVLQANTGDYTFANMRAQHLSPFWAAVAFLLAVAGFGAKAGILPLHVWLPEAHPAAPSPVSALMSGVMLKTAVYGLLRVSFDLLSEQAWWWGVSLLAIGLLSALFGVVFSAVQTDMKRLLAYSSIENIGLLLTGIGLGMVFNAYDMKALAALALTAALYHALSHAYFKSLLFLGTGLVLHATGERNLGRLGGLIRYMPWAAGVTLVGVLASAGLPPLGGFVSEWLLLQSFLFTPDLPDSFLNMLIPVAAAAVALVAALAGYTMVKFYGIIFLGQPREERLARAHDAAPWERFGMLWLAAGCVILGLLPTQIIQLIDPVTAQLVSHGLGRTVQAGGWWLVTPISVERASYGPVIFLLGIAISFALAFALVRRLYHGRLRRAAPWGCGYPSQNSRMQDTAEGFGQPIRQIFEPFFRTQRELPSPFDARPRYRVVVEDHLWYGIYLPIARLIERVAQVVCLLQQGRIAVYLLYSFVTLILMLMLVRA